MLANAGIQVRIFLNSKERTLDSLNSQTNATLFGRCCNGTDALNSFRLKNAAAFPGSPSRENSPPNRGSYGSRAIDLARELKRNSGTQVGYQPAYAEQQAKSRRWRGSRLLRKPDLQKEVLKGLRQGWSPAQVVGRLKKERRRTVISHETIYRFIDSQIRRTKDYSWRHYLPRGKSKRGWRGHKGGSPVDHIQDRVAIDRRPAYIHKRRQAGHWERE